MQAGAPDHAASLKEIVGLMPRARPSVESSRSKPRKPTRVCPQRLPRGLNGSAARNKRRQLPNRAQFPLVMPDRWRFERHHTLKAYTSTIAPPNRSCSFLSTYCHPWSRAGWVRLLRKNGRIISAISCIAKNPTPQRARRHVLNISCSDTDPNVR
jgi:hypothetical protein